MGGLRQECEHQAHMSYFSLSMLRASYGLGAGLLGGRFDEGTSLATIIVLLSVSIWL